MVRQSKASRRETCPEAGSLMTRGQLDGRCDAGAAEEARCTGMRSAHWQRLHKRTVSEHHATRGDWKATSGQSARLKTSTEASLTADALSAVGVFACASLHANESKARGPVRPSCLGGPVSVQGGNGASRPPALALVFQACGTSGSTCWWCAARACARDALIEMVRQVQRKAGSLNVPDDSNDV